MKSRNLTIMRKKGIHVPEFLTFSFESLIEDREIFRDELKKALEGQPSSFLLFQKKLTLLAKEKFRLRQECLSAKEGFLSEGDFFAVRSSCNMEDGREFSFAGIFESYLNVKRDDIRSKVLSCLQSLFTVKALEYMSLHHIDPAKIGMNVIVQRMIRADKSGILFTSNPQGIINETVITVGRGSGELVVSDRIETSTYFYHQTDKTYYREGEENILSEGELESLIKEGEKIREILNLKAADIEFSIQGDEIFILQARPVTGLEEGERIVLDNSNIVESYPGISLPLTESFAKTVYTAVFKGVAKRILPNKKLFVSLQDVFENMVDSMGGRMYYRIDNWYKILCFLPLSKKIIAVWQDMLGVKTKTYEKGGGAWRFWIKTVCGFRFIKEMLRLSESMEELDGIFKRTYEEFYKKDIKTLSPKEIKEEYEIIKDRLVPVWDITLINDMYAFIFTGLLKKRLKNHEKELSEFIGGIRDIESMKPVNAFRKLAFIKKNRGDCAYYRKELEKYIAAFGDRMIEELKLETETFRSNPQLLDKEIENFLKTTDRGGNIYQEGIKDKEEKHNALRKIDRFGPALFYAKRAKKGIEAREKSRLNRSRVFGMVRTIMLELAERYKEAGIIERKEDIFYLDLEEVFEPIDKRCEYKSLIEERKKIYEDYRGRAYCSRLVLQNEEAKQRYVRRKKAFTEKEGSIWYGTACSGGSISADIILVETPEEARNAEGKIILTKMTDPGWVFVLTYAAGIITEKGSLLSHTAIISRELGIPAIVGVDKICSILKSGDRVWMDGNTGTIKRIGGR